MNRYGVLGIDRLTREERESLRAAATRNLVECCDQCRNLLRAQLQAEENRGPAFIERC